MTPSPAPAAPRWADLGLRALSAAVLIPAVLLDVWLGGAWFELFVALLCVLMAQEWVTLTHRDDPLQFALHAGAALAGAILPLQAGAGTAIIAVLVLAALSVTLSHFTRPESPKWAYLGVAYVGLPAIALVLLRGDPGYGLLAIVWVLVTVWAADTLAYFAGRIIGGPKLAPRLSPKKTWAGLGGAMAGSAIAAIAVAVIARLEGVVPLAFIAALLAIVEQAGDLFKSAWKRHFGVKDSGHLIPGHGGVIDRVDGLVAVATAAFILGLIRGGLHAPGAGLLGW